MKKTILAALAAVAALAVTAAPASADFGIATFSASTTTTQAGAHPDSTVDFTFNTVEDPANPGHLLPDGHIKDTVTSMPAGMLGNPQAIPKCSPAQLNQNACPLASQIGTVTVTTTLAPFTQGVYNLEPPKGLPGQFGFNVLGIAPVYIRVTVRSDGDYGLDTNLSGLGEVLPVLGTTLTLWGVPADHDTGGPRVPFMTNPTQCDTGPVTAVRARAWGQQDWVSVSDEDVPPTGCDQLSIAPELKVTPETARADSPSGYTIDLTIPQNDDPDGLATPTVRRVDVTLPEGTSLNPGAVDGLRMCTDAELGVGTLDAAACPDASKVGTVTFESPIAPEPMQGAVYLLAPAPGAPFRIGFDAAGHGVRIKTAGTVQVDPETGRLTTTFDDQPQLPFSKLSMKFKGGPRALLANPATCGPHESRVTVTPHGSAAATAVSSFVTQGADCALAAFAPAFSAGGTSTVAGGDTSFTMTLARADGQATLSGLRMSLPPGLAGRLDAVPACPVAAAAAGTCSEASRIGSVVVAAGAGSQPLHLPGRVYLTEGDASSIAGLSLVIPVQAGPLNLGTTVVRARIALRPSDFGLDIVSDPLPKMHVGIPLRIRSIGVDLDRPGFMINPSSCAPLPVTATVTGAGGATATLRDRFQVGGCDKLAFAPALSIKAGAKGRTAKGKATPLTVTLTQKPGQARMRMTSLRLPANFTASPSALRSLCAPADLAAGRCAKRSVVGQATATTPLLAKPVSGPVYLVASPAGLPTLAVRMSGRIPMAIDGTLAIGKRGQMTTTFKPLPDLPLTKFVLRLGGAGAGTTPLAVARDLCVGHPADARARQTSHAGHGLTKYVPVRVSGCRKPKHKR